MSTKPMFVRQAAAGFLTCLVAVCIPSTLHSRVLDDFNDNTKTSWLDFTFIEGFGLPAETGGRFEFVQSPAGQDIFSASQKVSETIELKEGRTVELRVDLVESSGEDAFAVLAFIPNTGGNSPGTLAGYGLAKDPTDVLITKGVQKYFVDDDGVTAELKNTNVTLVLNLAVKSGAVTVRGRILDKDNNDAVLWDRTVVDTVAADVMEDGDDDPAAPYITSGYFTLYCYQQFNAAAPYRVVYDNAEVFVVDEVVLDDFNDNTKTSWLDFTFIEGFGLPTESGGQLRFELPPAGQDIFSASQKTSRTVELSEGERVELQVDLVESSGEDAFAVLAFIPNTGGNSPGTLAGYGLAKDPTDVLMTKGVQKYFVADDGVTAELKNTNVTLVVSLEVKSGNVIFTGRMLDKDNDNAVLWERTVVDTPAADVMEDGTDDPSAPYITSGYFTLYCYQQFNAPANYAVVFDNAVLRAPPVGANLAPQLSDILPAEYANFLPASTQVSFTVTDDKPIDEGMLSVDLNGTNYTTANGLVVTGAGNTRAVTLGGVATNVNYAAVLRAADAEGGQVLRNLYFDTFVTSVLQVEIEDYNFDGGQFFNAPTITPEGIGDETGYGGRTGWLGVDYSDTETTPEDVGEFRHRYEHYDRHQRSRDKVRAKYTAAGGAAAGYYDYDVIEIASGEWLNYTRYFTPGTYEVYLRQGMANMATANSVLERVTSNASLPNQTTTQLGTFLGSLTGFQYRNFPLTDGTGNKVVLRLSGEVTLRLRQVDADIPGGARFQNYLIFIPVPDTGPQRAAVTSVTPGSGSTARTVQPVIEAVIDNRETTVQVNTVRMEVNGSPVDATVTSTTTGARATYAIDPLPPANSVVAARVVYTDSQSVTLTNDWSFVLAYNQLVPAHGLAGTGTTRGFNVHVVQAPPGSNLENSLARAESQLAAGSSIARVVDTTVVASVINYSEVAGGANGNFPADVLVPGLAVATGTDDIAMEITTYLELATGVYQLAANCDDGYKVQAVADLAANNATAPALAFRNGEPANEAYSFVVTKAGFYPFRMVWYERGGGAHVEWSIQDLETGVRTLLNDTASPIRAWSAIEVAQERELAMPTLSGGSVTITWTGGGELFSATALGGPWTGTGDSDGSFSEPATGTKFYQVR